VVTFAAIPLFIVTAKLMVRLLRTGWKFDAVSAEELLKKDPRPPVVYLRSFHDDDQLMPGSGLMHRLTASWQWTAAVTPEQELAMILNRAGPVIAIGKPGEELPELGAARLYVDDAGWQVKVTELLAQARLVVIRSGATASLRWELDQAAERVPRSRLLLVLLGAGEDAVAFQHEVEQRFGPPEMMTPPPKTSLLLKLVRLVLPVAGDLGTVIYFSSRGEPRAEAIRFVLTWRWIVLGPYRRYQEPMDRAFQRVFRALELPWRKKSNRTIAVVLGLVGGMWGVHLFYLGRRRQGLKYLLFFWTLIPLVLGWRDAVRLALMDEEEFEKQYGVPPSTGGGR
jgi:TM2 domain-containing membrane protein YozV